MKVVIFAGGLGTRLSEETNLLPKPMIEIGDKPILWHIMKSYSRYGFSDFVILVGYKSYLVKEYFLNYCLHQSDVRVDLRSNSVEYLASSTEPWTVTLLDTGQDTLTGTRLSKARHVLNDQQFLLTYGDGLSDVNLNDLLKFHNLHDGIVTMTAVQPAGRFGTFNSNECTGQIKTFTEKPSGDGSWINGGFFVCDSQVFDYIDIHNNVAFEDQPLQSLANAGLLYSYKHNGFWKCMDTLRDKIEINAISSQSAPWLRAISS